MKSPGARRSAWATRAITLIYVQNMLGVFPADGDFGPITDAAVRGYQSAYGEGVTSDGIVGPKTWAALDYLEHAKASGNDRLPQDMARRIIDIAEKSAIAKYSWKDRGKLPLGYTAGIAQCFGLAATRLLAGHPIATTAAQADRNLPDYDALSWYREQFMAAGMRTIEDGIDTLRHLFVLLLGLGARESSGRYCEGRDMSAATSPPTPLRRRCIKPSWNIRICFELDPAAVAGILGEPEWIPRRRSRTA